MEIVYEVDGIPSSSCTLFRSRDTATAHPTGDLRLAVCHECGFIQNDAFDAALVDYEAPYEESQGNSKTFLQFASETITGLVERHGLAGKRIFEVGCGKAEWLALACRLGDMHGLGIDPGYVSDRVAPEDATRFDVIVDFFEADKTHLTGDLIACRHTLEHVADPLEFTTLLATSASRTPGAVVFIEVPDASRILEEGAFWDVYYEHSGYFTPTSLDGLLRRAGLASVDVREAYGNQYLVAEAQVDGASHPTSSPGPVIERARSFGEHATAQVDAWRTRLANTSGPVVAWAATSKTVGFLSGTGLPVAAAVDINPAKHDSYLAGTGTPVISPAALPEIGPELVVAMNPIYRNEIRSDLDRLGIDCELLSLGDAPV